MTNKDEVILRRTLMVSQFAKNIDKQCSRAVSTIPKDLSQGYVGKIYPKKNSITFKNSQDLGIRSQV